MDLQDILLVSIPPQEKERGRTSKMGRRLENIFFEGGEGKFQRNIGKQARIGKVAGDFCSLWAKDMEIRTLKAKRM